ncbi:MAG: biopolymer transporter ExbD [Pseudomonadota bacterium]
MASAARLGPVRAKRRNLSLLPLVDVIFLLLIFFMFSSNLSPFSLLQLTRDRAVSETAVAPDEATPPQPGDLAAGRVDLVLRVGPGDQMRLNGATLPAAELVSTLAGMRDAGARTLMIAPASGATVQDLVTALEAAKRSGLPQVAIRQ